MGMYWTISTTKSVPLVSGNAEYAAEVENVSWQMMNHAMCPMIVKAAYVKEILGIVFRAKCWAIVR